MSLVSERAQARRADGVEDPNPRVRRPHFDDVWAVAAVAAATVLALAARLATIDLAYQLRVGAMIRHGGGLPNLEVMSFAADGGAWTDQQWAGQVLLSSIHEVGGFEGLVFARGILAAGIAALVFASCRTRGASARVSALVTVATYVVCMPFMALRPQLLGALAFALVCYVLAARDRRPRLIWAIPIVTLLWVNVHGSFVLAPVAMGFALLDDVIARRRIAATAAAGVATVLATLVNPFGARAWWYVVDLGTDTTIRTAVEEWRPPTPEAPAGLVFLVALIAFGGLLARRGGRLRAAELVWIGVLTLMAFAALRNVLWWALAAAPLVATMLASPKRQPAAGNRRINAIVIACLLAAIVLMLPWIGRPGPIVADAPPRSLMDAARSALPEGSRVFVDQPWASWVEFDLPEVQVFVDSRIEVFSDAVWDDYLQTISGRPEATAILDRWKVDAVIISGEHRALVEELGRSGGWTEVEQDEGGTLWLRGS